MFVLLKDLNPKITKGMQGVILEIYNNGEAFEVEFPLEDGTNITYDGRITFIVNKEQIKKVKYWKQKQ